MLLAIVFITAYQVRAQAKIEIREFQGTLQNFEVGYRFAYEYLTLKVESEEYRFYFPPFHGQWIQSKFKPGDLVKVKVLLLRPFTLSLQGRYLEIKSFITRFLCGGKVKHK